MHLFPMFQSTDQIHQVLQLWQRYSNPYKDRKLKSQRNMYTFGWIVVTSLWHCDLTVTSLWRHWNDGYICGNVRKNPNGRNIALVQVSELLLFSQKINHVSKFKCEKNSGYLHLCGIYNHNHHHHHHCRRHHHHHHHQHHRHHHHMHILLLLL